MITMEMVGAALYDNNLHLRINEAKFVANFALKMCKTQFFSPLHLDVSKEQPTSTQK